MIKDWWLVCVWLLTLGVAYLIGSSQTQHPLQNIPESSQGIAIEVQQTVEPEGPTDIAPAQTVKSSLKTPATAAPQQASLSVKQEEVSSPDIIIPDPSPINLTNALLEAFEDPNPESRKETIASILSSLTTDNLKDILNAFEKLSPTFANMSEYRMLMKAWGDFDPLGAITYAEQHIGGTVAMYAIEDAVESWASYDPQAAIDWVSLQDDGLAKQLYNIGIVSGWAQIDVKGAAEYAAALNLTKGWEKARIAETLISEYYRLGPDQAASFVQGISADLKSDAFSFLTQQWAKQNPSAAADWLNTYTNQPYTDTAFEQLALIWAQEQPQAAINYFNTLPEGVSKQNAIKQAISTWTSNNPEEAEEWLFNQAESSSLDYAIGSYATEIAANDPYRALQWVANINDDKLKEDSTIEVVVNWHKEDPEAVKVWLPASDLSADLTSKIKRYIE